MCDGTKKQSSKSDARRLNDSEKNQLPDSVLFKFSDLEARIHNFDDENCRCIKNGYESPNWNWGNYLNFLAEMTIL